MSRLDDIIRGLKEKKQDSPEKANAYEAPKIKTGDCGMNKLACSAQYQPDYKPREGEDKCAACLMNPMYGI